jgi:hypothetical protein
MRIWKIMEHVMAGRLELDDQDPSIQSALGLPVYQEAVKVLENPTKEGRREALAKLPAKIRPHVEARAIQLYNQRRRQG